MTGNDNENQASDGQVCAFCQGHYDFPSELSRGLMLPRIGGSDTKVFICWECAIYLYARLSAHVSSIAYGALFNKRNPCRPSEYLPWLESRVELEPKE